jgi:hypothetical protein
MIAEIPKRALGLSHERRPLRLSVARRYPASSRRRGPIRLALWMKVAATGHAHRRPAPKALHRINLLLSASSRGPRSSAIIDVFDVGYQ